MGKHIKWWCFHDLQSNNLIVSEMPMHLKTTEQWKLFCIFMPDVTEKWKNVTKL